MGSVALRPHVHWAATETYMMHVLAERMQGREREARDAWRVPFPVSPRPEIQDRERETKRKRRDQSKGTYDYGGNMVYFEVPSRMGWSSYFVTFWHPRSVVGSDQS